MNWSRHKVSRRAKMLGNAASHPCTNRPMRLRTVAVLVATFSSSVFAQLPSGKRGITAEDYLQFELVSDRACRRTGLRSCTSSLESIAPRIAAFRRCGLHRLTEVVRRAFSSTKPGRRVRRAGRLTDPQSRSSPLVQLATPQHGLELYRPVARNSGSSRRRPARRGASRRWPMAYRTACGRRTRSTRSVCRAPVQATRGRPGRSEATCATIRRAHTSSMTTAGSTTAARICGTWT